MKEEDAKKKICPMMSSDTGVHCVARDCAVWESFEWTRANVIKKDAVIQNSWRRASAIEIKEYHREIPEGEKLILQNVKKGEGLCGLITKPLEM